MQLASENDYGAKASKDLIVTRGAGFRKEKNKKKRGSYRGGEITVCASKTHIVFFTERQCQLTSHSIKFTD